MNERYLCLACLCACGTNARQPDQDVVTVMAPLAPDALIAYRDGDAPWMTTTGAQTPLSFQASSGMFSVAITCPSKQQGVDVYELMVADLQTLDYGYECKSPSAMLTGAILGASPMDSINVQWGQSANAWGTPDQSSYALDVATGKHDLLAARGRLVPDRLAVLRDVEVTGNTSSDIDFDGPNSVALEPYTVGSRNILHVTYVTAGGTPIFLSQGTEVVTVVPATAMAPGDLQLFFVATGGLDGTYPWSSVLHAGREPPSAFAKSPLVDERPTVTVTPAGAYVSLQASWQPQSGAVLYRFSANGWSAHVSAARFDATGTLELPDMSTVAGWDPALGISPGRIVWNVSAVKGTELDELLRPFPSHEAAITMSGWRDDMR